MGGYAPTPVDTAPTTREQADIQNTILQRNRQAAGLSYYQQVQQQAVQPQQEQNPYNPLLQPGRYSNWLLSHPTAVPMQKAQAEYEYHEEMVRVSNINKYAVQNRPGYTELSQLGDRATQQLLFMTDMQRQVFAQMGIETTGREQMAGMILEAQRQAAYKTATLTDDRYFSGELQKWGENFVERGSAQHFYLKDTGQVGTNEFEFAADLAVEFLKGKPEKRSEWFSPVSGQMSAFLPGGRGLQEYSWDSAIAASRGLSQPGQVSFMNAIERLGSARGTLFAPSYYKTPRNPSISSFGGGIQPSGLPSGVFFTGKIERVEAREEPRAFSFGGIISDFTKSFGQLKQGDIFGGIGLYSQGLSRYSTRAAMPDITGFGKYVEERDTSQSPVGTVVTGAAYVGETIYSDIRKDPVMDVFLYGLPFGFKYGESLLGGGVARAATSGSLFLNVPGRALSTPAAKTFGSLAKAGIVGLYAFQSGVNIWEAPNTPKGKGEALGHVGYQVGMMVAGIPLAASYTPAVRENPFESRTFFTGERKLPLSEKVMIRASDFVNSLTQTKGQKAAIRDISTEYMGKSASFTKPEITTVEPDFADLTHVGSKNAPAVKMAMMEQPSVGYGSGMMEAQIGTRPAAMKLRATALPSADADILAEFPDIMKAEAGEVAARGMDIHTFPEGYPDVGQGANAPVEPGSYLFGNRYRINPYIDEITRPGITPEYKGEIAFEQLNVQFRKLSSAVRDDIAAPMEKGYRLGKDVSRLTRVRDVLAEIKGTKGSAFDEMLKQEITYNAQISKSGNPRILTETLGEVRARYEGNPKTDIPDLFSKYTKGAVSSLGSAIAPSVLISSFRPSSSSPSISRLSPSSIKSPGYPSISIVPSYTSTIPSRRTPTIPSSPPWFPSVTALPPQSTPPRSSRPYTPPYTPPVSPPSTPPRSPPSSTPYTPTPPYTPPPYSPPPTIPVIGGMPPFMGGSSGSPFGMRTASPWSRKNLVGAELFMRKPKGRKGGIFRPPF